MTGVVLWKELREQRSIWLAMVGSAWLALIGLPITLDLMGINTNNGLREYLAFTLTILVWTYGLVCGGMLLAGERESGTLRFLDNLPGLRLRLWRSKAKAGVVLVAAECVAVTGLAIAYQLPASPAEIGIGGLVLLASGLLGYAWGMFVSANGSNVLNSVALAIFYQPVAAAFVYAIVFVFGTILHIFLDLDRVSRSPGPYIVVIFAIMIIVPLTASALIFSATDRERLRSPRRRIVPRPEKALTQRLDVLLWLTYMQSRRLMIGLGICCLSGGFLLLAAGLALWMVATLLVGVLCGVTVFMDEQTSGSFRFLGDQRFPLGRIWWFKVGYHFLLACAAALLLLLPGLLSVLPRLFESDRYQHNPFFVLGEVFHTRLLQYFIPTGIWLGLWLIYGFSIGHLCGLLFRRSLIAVVVALMMTGMVTSLWLPSMLGGGLHNWQVFAVPILLLVTARLILHSWATDRLLSPGGISRIAAGLLLCILWIAGSVWFRVAEVPDVPDQLNVPEFVAGLPTPEENKAGLHIRSAAVSLETWEKNHAQLKPTKPLFPGKKFNKKLPFTYQLGDVLEQGWPGGQPELGGWLDLVFKSKWPKELAPIVDLPLGAVEDPRSLTTITPIRSLEPCRTMGQLLAVRGLQQQAQGDPRVFLNNLRVGLALSRNLRHDAIQVSVRHGWQSEGHLLRGLERWLERLDKHPDLLRETLTLLLRHEAELPDDYLQAKKAEYLVALNSLDQPEAAIILPFDWHSTASAEVDMIRLAWQVPWERERHLRLLRALHQGSPQERYSARRMNMPEMIETSVDTFFAEPDVSSRKAARARLHAAQLQVALRLYQAETGKPAESLGVLKPKYLRDIPTDPFDDQDFRYRISQGEKLPLPQGERPGVRRIPPGQGILWSVGPDKQNDGGRARARQQQRSDSGGNLIFLVPLPPKGK